MKPPPVLYALCVLAPVVMLHIQMDLAAPCIMQSEDSFRLNWTSPWSTIFDSCLASPRLPRPPRPPLYQRACMPADLSATRRSLSSHRLAALLWSWACADGRQRKQLLKYMPPTPSSSGATAQYTVVAAPCCMDLVNGLAREKTKVISHQLRWMEVYIMFPGCTALEVTPWGERRRWSSLLKRTLQSLARL